MKVKTTVILRWILLLTCSRVSCSKILELNDLNDKGKAINLIGTIKDVNAQVEKDFQNLLYDTVERYATDADADGETKPDVKDFKYKRLIKRIVPHGYELKDSDYDEKFKTIFKPLVRIHKNQPELLDSSEDSYELIYILDDERFEDNAKLENDISLLEPFSMGNIDVKYFPSDEVGFVNNVKKKNNYNSQLSNRMSELTQSRFKMVNNENEIIKTITPKYLLNLHKITDNAKLKQNLDTNTEHWISNEQDLTTNEQDLTTNEQDSTRSKKLHDLLNKIAKFRFNKNKLISEPKTKSETSQRFVAMGQLSSKQFKPDVKNNGYQKSVFRSLKLKPSNDVDEEKYQDILDKLKRNVNKDMKVKDNKKEIKPLEWFGPVGLINSKQFLQTYVDDKISEPEKHNYRNDIKYLDYHPLENDEDFIGSLKEYIQQHEPTYNGKRILELDNESIQDNLKELFATVGHMNSKHITHGMLKREINEPIYFIKLKNYKQNDNKYNSNNDKFTMTSEVNQLDTINLEKELIAQLNEKKQRAADTLRMHIKSGEEDIEVQKQIAQFDYVDGEIIEDNTQKPLYPFWNEWTYDMQIPQDNCEGNLVQLGPLCVGAWA